MTLERRTEKPVQPYGSFEDNPYIGGVTARDFAPLEFRMIQAVSQAAKDKLAEPGTFFCPQSGENYSELVFVPLRVQGTRTLWSDDPSQAAPSCASNNRIHANATGVAFPNQICAQCEYMTDEPYLIEAEQRRSYCTPGFTILGIDQGSNMPFLFRATGTAVRAIQNMLTMIQASGGKPYTLVIAFTAIERARGRQTFYQLVANNRGKVEEALLGDYKAMADYWAQQAVAWASDGSDSSGNPTEVQEQIRRQEQQSAPAGGATVIDQSGAPVNEAPAPPAPPAARTAPPAPPKPSAAKPAAPQAARRTSVPATRPAPAVRRGPPPGGMRQAPGATAPGTAVATEKEETPW